MNDDTCNPRLAAASIPPARLAEFGRVDFDPVTVEADGLAGVCMDARFQVLEVLLPGLDAGHEPGRVATALKDAFNEAMQQVMQRHAARLEALVQEACAPA